MEQSRPSHISVLRCIDEAYRTYFKYTGREPDTIFLDRGTVAVLNRGMSPYMVPRGKKDDLPDYGSYVRGLRIREVLTSDFIVIAAEADHAKEV